MLAQSDTRFYRAVSSPSLWNFDFKLYRKGEKEPITVSDYSYTLGIRRSFKLRADLIAGDYVVHVRLDRSFDEDKVSRSLRLVY